MRIAHQALIAAIALLLVGCAHYEPVNQGGRLLMPAQGRIFLLRKQMGTSLMVCDANTASAAPVCYDASSMPASLQASR